MICSGRLIVVFALLTSFSIETYATESGTANKVLRAGAYAIDITPEYFPVSSNGNTSDRQATVAHDPLHARCLVLHNGETSLAIVVCDNCKIPRDIFDAAKAIASRRTGIPLANMLMSATHTHSAVTVTGTFQSEPEVRYREFLVRRIAEGIEQAHQQYQPARIGWTTAEDATQVFNRRWFTKPGVENRDPFGKSGEAVLMNPGFDKNVIDRPSGPTDPQIGLLAVQNLDGTPIALLANYSLHYVGGFEENALSADYFAEFANLMAQKVGATNVNPPFVGIMSNGTSGNINNKNFGADSYVGKPPYEQMRFVANSVAEAAFAAWKQIEYHDWVPLDAVQTEIELGVRRPSAEDVTRAKEILAAAGEGPYSDIEELYARETVLLVDYPPHVKSMIQALRIGDVGIVGIVGIPCETFVETGLAIKAASPLPQTFCISLANGYNGYLPTPEHHGWGGYETWRARSSYLAVDAEPAVRQTALQLLGELAKEQP
jgi:neutral ceramidase